MRNKEVEMNKEKRSFAWDTIMLIGVTKSESLFKESGGPMFVRGTDIEVKWCPTTKMFWEV